jgi:ankyrin repeat protein
MVDEDTASMTLEEAYAVFDRFTPFSPGGPPSAKALRRLGIHARKIFYGRQSLLHRCMETQGHRLDLIQVLVEGFPGALQLYDVDGYLPLHYAVGSPRYPLQISVDVMDYLIQQEPLALLRTTRNSRRAIPLHLATENPHLTVPMLDTLLAVFPETLHYRDAYDHQPLDGALRLSSGILNQSVLRRLIQAAPVLLASVKEDDGRLVLHRVLEEARATAETHERLGPAEAALLELLVETYPGALRIQTPERLTPLALACTADLPLACVYPLLRAWPEQVTTQGAFIFESKDWNGALLPSHLLSESLSWRHVQQWLEQDDQAATALDAVGRTALHVAVVSRAACIVALVRTLLENNPSAASTVDQHGRLVLHYAALSTHDERDQVLELLGKAYPEAFAVADTDGCFPWMYAELAQFSAVYDDTLLHYPDAVDGVEDLPEEVRWDIVQVAREEEDD